MGSGEAVRFVLRRSSIRRRLPSPGITVMFGRRESSSISFFPRLRTRPDIPRLRARPATDQAADFGNELGRYQHDREAFDFHGRFVFSHFLVLRLPVVVGDKLPYSFFIPPTRECLFRAPNRLG